MDVLHRGEARESVRAQHPAVARHGVVERQVEFRGRPDVAQDAHDDAALGVGVRLFERDAALVHEHLHEGVVLRHLDDLALVHDVGAGIADVGQRQPVAGLQESRDGGAHACELALLDHGAADLVVSGEDRGLEVVEDPAVVVRFVEEGQAADGDRGGDVAAGVTAHAVRDEEEVSARVAGVLVVLAHLAGVRARCEVEGRHAGVRGSGALCVHARSSIVV